ncbi:MAG TPA: PQQ-dependent sugar dehydrogenase [Acidimicrobiales bacterium]|nr:PQQ-dependent sugar dehydrogenase [Acidimicrobiales bacterium]
MTSRIALLALVAVALVAGACGGDDGGAASTPQPTGTVEGAPTTEAPTDEPGTEQESPSLDDVRVRLVEVARLDAPVAMAVRPGHEDVLYLAERAGRVRLLRGDDVDPTPLLDITAATTTDAERGLLGLAFSPDGDRLYVSSTDPGGDSLLVEYAMGDAPDELDESSARTVMQVAQPFGNHNGGHITFGPDGFLWYGLGDGGGGGDPHGNGQDTSTLLGSLLRIDPRPNGDDPYGIPADNPFVDGGGRAEIWAYGLRNPWRFTFDRATDDLWIADVGQSRVEEVNHLPAAEGTGRGANLGWNRLEGSEAFEGQPPADHTLPVFEYARTGARCSVTGGHVYRGSAVPALVGAYVWGDYCESQVHAIAVKRGEVTAEAALGVGVDPGTLASFGQDAAGELYVLSLGGSVWRLEAA